MEEPRSRWLPTADADPPSLSYGHLVSASPRTLLGAVSKARRPSAAAGGGAAAVSVSQLARSGTRPSSRLRPALVCARVPRWWRVAQPSGLSGYTETVTCRYVAGIDVAVLLPLAFCSLASASSSLCSSPSRPLALAASNAFMVGP